LFTVAGPEADTLVPESVTDALVTVIVVLIAAACASMIMSNAGTNREKFRRMIL
jgi:hypothetical protein